MWAAICKTAPRQLSSIDDSDRQGLTKQMNRQHRPTKAAANDQDIKLRLGHG
jgi:hypothetical protein